MDPLSITASTITLIQAAGAVSATLYEFITTFRNADARVRDLCNELSRLVKFLEAVGRTLKKCRGTLSLASMDADLWHQSEISLEDCKITLDELASFVNKIKAATKPSGIFRRAKVALDLTMYAGDISGFEEKIHKSNCALQTMLSAIQVSLSLRGNETQDKILYELGKLKRSIEQSTQVAHHYGDRFSHTLSDPSDERVAYNLGNLARVAQNFHSSASSTASTIHGANGTSFWNIQSDAAMSLNGGSGLTPNKRQQINQYIKQQRRMTKRKPRRYVPSSTVASVILPQPVPASEVSPEETESNISEIGEEIDERDEDAELELFLLSGLEEVAKDSMLSQDFAKAQGMLEEAIRRHTGSTTEEIDIKQLQVQLALCYFFQHKWQLAEPLIDRIAKSKANFDPVVCNLLHALALANLTNHRFEKALSACKQALQGKRRLKRAFGSASEAECNDTLGLLATIYDIKGNPVDAEALRRKMPRNLSYYHPDNELEFIINHPKLCKEVFGKKMTLDWRRPRPSTVVPAGNDLSSTEETIVETSNTGKTTKPTLQTFHTKLSSYEKVNMDTSKQVVGLWNDSGSDNDGTLSTSCSSPSSDANRHFFHIPIKRLLTRRVARFLGTSREQPASPKSPQGEFGSPLTPHTEDVPLRPKVGKGFWSKSDTNLIKPKRPRRRLRKVASDETVDNLFSPSRGPGYSAVFTRATSGGPPTYESHDIPDPRPWRYGVDKWLRMGSRLRSHKDRRSSWVPASRIISSPTEYKSWNGRALHELPCDLPVELPDNPIQCLEKFRTLNNSSSVRDILGIPSAKREGFESQYSLKPRPQKLRITIPNIGRSLEGIPFTYLPYRPSTRTERRPSISAMNQEVQTNRSSLTILSSKLSDEEKIERDFDEFVRKNNNSRLAWVPASYFKERNSIPSPIRPGVDEPKSREKFAETKGLKVDLGEDMGTSKSISREQEGSIYENHKDPGSDVAPKLNRKFSWEHSPSKEEIRPLTPLTVSKSVSQTPQIPRLDRKLSWTSDDSDQLPDLVRPSSSSSSSDASVSSAITGPILKFDPIIKDLTIFGSDNSPSPTGSQSLHEFLERLSDSVFETGLASNKAIDGSHSLILATKEQENKVPAAVVDKTIKPIEERNEIEHVEQHQQSTSSKGDIPSTADDNTSPQPGTKPQASQEISSLPSTPILPKSAIKSEESPISAVTLRKQAGRMLDRKHPLRSRDKLSLKFDIEKDEYFEPRSAKTRKDLMKEAEKLYATALFGIGDLRNGIVV